MTSPEPSFNWDKLIEMTIACFTVFGMFWKGVDEYFKHKREEKAKFIVEVVTATMDGVLREFKEDFHEFKSRTEAQMNDFHGIVRNILQEVRK